MVGGTHYGSVATPYADTILRYDADAASWEVLPQRLEDPTVVQVALMAPEDFPVDCS